ncbi:MAG TPA: alpha-glucan family phosphorylase [Fibrobacteria bacterium]|nr:alpha-glucan family phosphorylase [Fibrobacteria bacterium]
MSGSETDVPALPDKSLGGPLTVAPKDADIAYFSMEVGFDPGMPTYSGGLGMLAGDTIRSAADLKLPLVAVTLLHRHGYFFQRLAADGSQSEQPSEWAVGDFLTRVPATVEVTLAGRPVKITAWIGSVKGITGHVLPVYFLDTDVEGNGEWERTLTHSLYGGDVRYRLAQEAVLGIGGIRMLRALGYVGLNRFHMNEGHSALLTLELLSEESGHSGQAEILPEHIEAVRRRCVFTTHTPVPAGHDQFTLELVREMLGGGKPFQLTGLFCHDGLLNMTFLAMNASHYINGVAKRHGEVSRHLFAKYAIDSITNGVHARTWVSPAFADLFDRHVPGWREDNFSLRSALGIPPEEIWWAHQTAKSVLLQEVNRSANAGMDTDVLTIGFARRATAYKRPALIFRDPETLKAIAAKHGGLQLIFAGKAHPQDQDGKDIIRDLFRIRESLGPRIRMAYLENYDMELGRLLTSGTDIWLNTPEPPMEASGTSGMKAAMNGVPSFSIRDGWWLEGHIEGVTGWSIGPGMNGVGGPRNDAEDAATLYAKLDQSIYPLFNDNRRGFIDIMKHAIALNASFFNTQRMVLQYLANAWFL